MVITKKILGQYTDLMKEVEENRDKIKKIKNDIDRITTQIDKIEQGGTVKDKVKGGLGGIQNFNIEGFPSKEYNSKKTMLYTKKIMLNRRKALLEEQDCKIIELTSYLEEFMHNIDDSHIRRIVNLRYIEKLSWNEVANRIGGGNTEDSVRKMLERFLEKQ